MTPSTDELLFMAASNIVEAGNRRAFLEFACRGDIDRLRRLEELLEIQDEAEDYFEFQPELEKASASSGPGDADGEIGARIGPYRLIDRLGSGGCGVVYLAEQLEPVKRKVALKIIRLGLNTENVIGRFNLEREALALMDHPNIARVLDAGATGSGRPYLVMELVDGEKITEFCDRNGFGIRQRLVLFVLVCEAIQHAHQKGVIHRDIKPSNILVREHDGRAVPKVIDFGIAKATTGSQDAEATAMGSGQLIGTPAYMSPEQAETGVDIDTRSDIYSLGALLCELLTGSPPFRLDHFTDRSSDEIRAILREEETGLPSARLRDTTQEEMGKIAARRGIDRERLPSVLAGDLDWIVMKAIEKERQRRYETANGLGMDVQRYLNEEPVLARPPSRRYLLTKLVRRNRVTFAAASIALFGLLGGFGVSTWLFFRERDARQEQARLRMVAELATANEVRLREDARSADLVRQAAVYLKYNETEHADQLLEGMPAEQAPRSLEAVDTFKAVANWNLTQGHWKTAAERFFSLAHVTTSVDMTDSDQISYELLPAVTAVREWGEPGQYDHIRKLAISRFADSSNPIVAEQVIKAVLLEPATPETLKKILPLAKVVEDSLAGPDMEKDPLNVSWRQFSLALLALRQGNLETAGELAHRSLAADSNSQPRSVSNRAILAMVDQEQGRVPEALGTLEDLRSQLDEWAAGPFQIHNPDGTMWSNWGIALLLLKEAEGM